VKKCIYKIIGMDVKLNLACKLIRTKTRRIRASIINFTFNPEIPPALIGQS